MGGVGGLLATGFYPEETDGKGIWQWAEPRCSIELPSGCTAASLRVSSLLTLATGRTLKVRIAGAGGRPLGEKILDGPPECLVVTSAEGGRVEIASAPAWSPCEIFENNADQRRLGFCLHGIDLLEANASRRSFSRLADYLGPGWLPVESDGASDWAWMGASAILVVPEGVRALAISVASPHVEKTSQQLEITATAAGGAVVARRLLGGPVESFVIRCEGEPFVTLVASRTWSPSEIYGGDDNRKLSVCLHSVFGMQTSSTFAPLSFEVELTTRCNINPPCVQCYPRQGPKDTEGRTDGEYIPPGLDMPRPLFDKIFPTMQKARVLSLHGVGEPLLTPLLRESLEKTDPSLTYRQFNSNGLLLNQRNCEFLIAARTQYCNVSLDAASEEMFRAVRGEGWPIIIRNLKHFSEMKHQMQVSHPLIAINMTLMKVNYREAPAFIELAREIGVDRVIFSKLEPADDYFMERKGLLFRYSDQYIDISDTSFRDTLKEAFRLGAEYGIETIAIVPNIFG
ncbi:MAG: hypothetical protein HYX75_05730 [Acidobacteria bacterium]|nr:hypothetical protein [Acidobacteriota bacterium]